MERTICIGDVHGCIDELRELLAKLRLGPYDRVVFLGDLIDRGLDPVGVVRLIRALGRRASCVLGNHDEKALRWRLREEQRLLTGRPNKMEPPTPERRVEWEALSPADLAWLGTLPITIDLGNNWIAVHGGFEWKRPLATQKKDRAIRCRFVDQLTGEMRNQDGKSDPWVKPPGTDDWAERWTETSVVYGHAVHSLSKPRVDRHPSTECWGIDTGCVFGGMLTALVLPTKEIVQVRAERQYAKPPVPLAP